MTGEFTCFGGIEWFNIEEGGAGLLEDAGLGVGIERAQDLDDLVRRDGFAFGQDGFHAATIASGFSRLCGLVVWTVLRG